MPALSRVERKETVETIASVQFASGCIPWCPGEHVDPWNHVEAAMALDPRWPVARGRARLRTGWPSASDADGGWASYYHADGERVKDPNVDTNLCAYVAVGVWQHWRETGDGRFLRRMWPVVDAAVEYVLDLQTDTRHRSGGPATPRASRGTRRCSPAVRRST